MKSWSSPSARTAAELKWPLKLEMNQKSMVVAANEFHIEEDGRLKLDNMSVALFGKDPGDGRGVEINTVRADTAYLTFDKPLGKNEKELGGNRRIVAAELSDNIEIVNNHRTPQRDDDLHLNILKGPLYFDEAKRLIWTDDDVHVEDDQSKPRPDEVRGQGMEVHLAAAEPAAKPAEKPAPRGKAKTETFTGVDRIVLLSDVDMNLYVAGDFLSGPAAGKEKAAAADASKPPAKPDAPPEKAHVNIYTPGRFEYVFHKDGDVALFDVPEADPTHAPQDDQDVHVDRITTSPDGKGELHDQLFCQHLELRLGHKESGPGARDDHSVDHGMEVQSAHAFGKKEVVLASDKQKLTARGYDFMYDARSQLTILKGDPNKAGFRDVGRLGQQPHPRPRNADPGHEGAGRQGLAAGDGQRAGQARPVRQEDREACPPTPTWRDKLVSTKDGDQDLMILTGKASFVDDDHDQTLQADTLKVWLAASDAAPANATPAAPQEAARRPNHVEAVGNVFAKSPQMTIPHAGQLVVWFHDVPDDELPPAGPAAKDAAKAKGDAPPAGKTTAAGSRPRRVKRRRRRRRAATPSAPNPAKADAEPPRPIDLTARYVYAWVDRGKEKNTLQKLQAEGDVHVVQAPAKADEKGVDIKGAALDMTYHPEGNFLVVQGDLAQMLMDKIYIIGPEINIDQAANKAWVEGPGAMQMESATNFQGEKLAKPVPMTVHWNNEMFFTGTHAEFRKASRPSRTTPTWPASSCSVFFDHAISLKEGNHDGPPPHVKNLVCLQGRPRRGPHPGRRPRHPLPAASGARPDHGRAGAGGRRPPSRRRAATATRSTRRGRATSACSSAAAPTTTRSARHVPPGPRRKRPSPAPKPGRRAQGRRRAKADEPMKLTYINFGTRGSMYANSKTNTRDVPGERARARHAVREPQHRDRPRRHARPPAGGGDVPARRPAGRVQPRRQDEVAEGDDRQGPRLRAGARSSRRCAT